MEEASHPKQLPLLPAGSNAATSLGFLMVVSRMLTRHQHEPRARLRSATSGTMKRKGAAAWTVQLANIDSEMHDSRQVLRFRQPFPKHLPSIRVSFFVSTFLQLFPSFLSCIFSQCVENTAAAISAVERTCLRIPCPRESRP